MRKPNGHRPQVLEDGTVLDGDGDLLGRIAQVPGGWLWENVMADNGVRNGLTTGRERTRRAALVQLGVKETV